MVIGGKIRCLHAKNGAELLLLHSMQSKKVVLGCLPLGRKPGVEGEREMLYYTKIQ